MGFSDLCTVIRRLLIAILLASPLPVYAQTTEQVWVEGDVYARLSQSVRFLGMLQTTQDQLIGELDLYAGGFVDFGLKPILRERIDSIDWLTTPMDYLRLRLGAAYLTPIVGGDDSHEIRIVADLTPRFRVWSSVLVAVRNRTEWRFIDGEFSFRYRPRIWVERTFYDVVGIPVTPYVAGELFYDSREGEFMRSRTLLGASFAFTTWLAHEIQVVYQRDWTDNGTSLFATDFIFAFYL